MNEKVDQLRELKEDLEAIERDHSETLGREHEISHPLHQAASEARRLYKQVTEGRENEGET